MTGMPESRRKPLGSGAWRGPPDDRIWEVLRLVAVGEAVRRVGGLDNARDAYDVLSVDEQQLVGVARLLLAAPRFAVLAPAALGTEQAAHVLATLAEHGIGYVVLGDGGLDRDSFDAVVEIAADGTWTHTGKTEVRQ